MVGFTRLFGQKESIKVLVAGDLLLDRYTIGSVKRISPESPVPVVAVEKEEVKAGGAGNVMLNLRALGADVVAMARVGNDPAGKQLKKELNLKGINTELIVTDQAPTPVKQRVIAEGQQLVRIDQEQILPLSLSAEAKLLYAIPEILQCCQVVAISDYGKGTLSDVLLHTLIHEAKRLGIPVVIDPKGNCYKKYEGATVVKPNRKEAYQAANCAPDTPLEQVVEIIRKQVDMETLMVTLSGEGIGYWDKTGGDIVSAQVKEIVDVTGAGDTVLASVTLALGNQLSIKEAAQLANIAAGLAIERLGCVSVCMQQIAERVLSLCLRKKFIKEQALSLLQVAVQDLAPTVVLLNTGQGFNQESYQILKKHKRQGVPFVVCCTDKDLCPLVIEFVTSLQEIDYVICANKDFVQKLQPGKVVDLSYKPGFKRFFTGSNQTCKSTNGSGTLKQNNFY